MFPSGWKSHTWNSYGSFGFGTSQFGLQTLSWELLDILKETCIALCNNEGSACLGHRRMLYLTKQLGLGLSLLYHRVTLTDKFQVFSFIT